MSLFRLSAVLNGHQSDVKAVAGYQGGIITGSRDHKVILWTKQGENIYNPSFQVESTDFINTVAHIPTIGDYPEGLVVSGGREKTIQVHKIEGPKLSHVWTLVGHTDNVCALGVLDEKKDQIYLVSGSWDKTARVWVNGVCIQTLEGHSAAVWAVLPLFVGSQLFIITASADKTIKIWENGICKKTIPAHTDCVRALTLIPGIGFASCGNDGAIKVWSFKGECLQQLYGHTSFVYSLAHLSSGELVSSGEDRTVRIWKDGECIQTINLPAISIWCVNTLPNGDIVCGSNDGVARVFTRYESRIADPGLVHEFEKSLADFAIPKNQIGDLQKEKVPGEEALQIPGKKAGEVKLIRTGEKVEAYQWNALENVWDKAGEVVDALGQSRKTMYEGREYDYVFDVDLEDGLPPRKLPYNITENPYTAAQKFIHRNEMNQDFLDQIARFIIQNTSSSHTPTFSYGGNTDPFTGSSAYTSGNQNYQGQTQTQASTSSYYPKKIHLVFDEAKLPQMLAKLLELNEKQEENRLNENEIDTLKQIITALENPSTFQKTEFQDRHFLTITKILQWPVETRFPALDLFRLFILHPSNATYYSKQGDQFIDTILFLGGFSAMDIDSKSTQTNRMLALKILVNLFKFDSGKKLVWQARTKIVSAVTDCWNSNSNAMRVALMTLFVNFSVELNITKDEELSLQILACLCEVIKKESQTSIQDNEVLFRSIVATGSILYSNHHLIPLAEGLGANNSISLVSNSGLDSNNKIKMASDALLVILNKK